MGKRRRERALRGLQEVGVARVVREAALDHRDRGVRVAIALAKAPEGEPPAAVQRVECDAAEVGGASPVFVAAPRECAPAKDKEVQICPQWTVRARLRPDSVGLLLGIEQRLAHPEGEISAGRRLHVDRTSSMREPVRGARCE